METYDLLTKQGTFSLDLPDGSPPPNMEQFKQAIRDGVAYRSDPTPGQPAQQETHSRSPLEILSRPIGSTINSLTDLMRKGAPGHPLSDRLIPEIKVPDAVEAAAVGTASALTGLGAGTALAPFVGNTALKFMLPTIGEMLGSFTGRKIGTAGGTEEKGLMGDIASVALPFLGAPTEGAIRTPARVITPQIGRQAAEELKRPLATRSATDLLLQDKPARFLQRGTRRSELQGEMRDVGEQIQTAFISSENQFRKLSDNVFNTVRDNVRTSAGNGNKPIMLDVTDVHVFAKRHGQTLPRLGIETISIKGAKKGDPTRHYMEFNEAMKLNSRLGSSARRAADRSVLMDASAWRELQGKVDAHVTRTAARYGQLDELTKARNMFRTEIVPRFRNNFARRVKSVAAEDLIKKGGLPNANLDSIQAKQLVDSLVNVMSNTLDDAGKPILSVSSARNALKEGVLMKVIESSVQPRTGALNGAKFLDDLTRIDKNVRDILLGKDLSSALEEFGQNISTATIRLGGGLRIGGAIASARGSAQSGGFSGVEHGLETINEVNFLARELIKSPRLANALVKRVIAGVPEAAVQLDKLTGLRILGMQSARQAITENDTSAEDLLRKIIEMGHVGEKISRPRAPNVRDNINKEANRIGIQEPKETRKTIRENIPSGPIENIFPKVNIRFPDARDNIR